MKRLATLLLAAGLVFGATSAAQAIEFKGSGVIQEYFVWSNNATVQSGDRTTGRFQAAQRVRLKLDIIASENLRGVFYIEDNIRWGNKGDKLGQDSGGSLGADGTNVQVKQAYIDWIIPATDVKVRMGIQGFSLPSMTVGSPVLSDDAAGINITKKFNDNISAALFWMRPWAQTDDDHSTVDFFGLVLPMSFDGFNVTPWAMYGQSGKDVGSYPDVVDYTEGSTPPAAVWATGDSDEKNYFFADSDIWFAGISAELIAFDPFRIAVDFNYGSADTEIERQGSDGWVVTVLADYKLDMMTPGLLFWYASGNDEDAGDVLSNEGSGLMPIFSPSWGGTSMGFAGYYGRGINGTEMSGDSPIGTWGVALQATDITFMEDLNHTLRFAYYQGTNESKGFYEPADTTLLHEDDSAFEINLDTKYQIYENLAFILELGFITYDYDDDGFNNLKNHTPYDDTAYRIAASFGYSF